MSDLLELIQEISKEQFLNDWKNEDDASGHCDQFMMERRDEHRSYSGLTYYIAALTEQGLENLIVWKHTDPGSVKKVKSGGDLLWEVVERYWQQIQNNQLDPCVEHCQKIKEELNTQLQSDEALITSDYSLSRVFSHRDC